MRDLEVAAHSQDGLVQVELTCRRDQDRTAGHHDRQRTRIPLPARSHIDGHLARIEGRVGGREREARTRPTIPITRASSFLRISPTPENCSACES